MVRVKDPRGRCPHHCTPSWLDNGHAWCSQCGVKLQVAPGSMTIVTPVPQPRWRWLKVFVAKTSPNAKKPTRHGVLVVEIETHLTEGLLARVTTKTFIRLKFGFGGRHV